MTIYAWILQVTGHSLIFCPILLESVSWRRAEMAYKRINKCVTVLTLTWNGSLQLLSVGWFHPPRHPWGSVGPFPYDSASDTWRRPSCSHTWTPGRTFRFPPVVFRRACLPTLLVCALVLDFLEWKILNKMFLVTQPELHRHFPIIWIHYRT